MYQEQKTPLCEPFTADQIKDGERCELSEGHRIYCLPAGDRHSRHNLSGGTLIDTDPDVEWAGVDTGFTPKSNTLRAPDIAVAPPPAEEGEWVPGAPLLAVEYADKGQNETDLKVKIRELLAAGTRFIWVARLTGPQRVEVHTRDRPMRVLSATDFLEAPGILRNPVRVQALFDRREAHRVTLRNLLQREGYEDLEAVLREGKAEGLIEGKAKGLIEGKAEGLIQGALEARIEAIFSTLAVRAIEVDTETRARIRGCRDPKQLDAWLRKAVLAESPSDIFQARKIVGT